MSIVSVSELDLFAKPPIQTSIEHATVKDNYPISSTIESGPLEFTITGNGEEYLDLSSAYLHIVAHVSKNGVANPEATDKALPVNNWAHSLFSQIDVSINGKMVSSSSNTYAYRAYIESLLSFGKACKETFLTNSLWYKDTAGHMDSLENVNAGAKKRLLFTTDEKKVDLIAYIHDDIFRQNRLIPPGVTVRVRFIRSPDNFNLMATKPGYKSLISSAVLYVKKCKVNPEVSLAHASVLKKSNMQFPIKRVDCKVFSITAGSLSAIRKEYYLDNYPNEL